MQKQNATEEQKKKIFAKFSTGLQKKITGRNRAINKKLTYVEKSTKFQPIGYVCTRPVELTKKKWETARSLFHSSDNTCLNKPPLMIKEAVPFTEERLQPVIRKIKCGKAPVLMAYHRMEVGMIAPKIIPGSLNDLLKKKKFPPS